MGIILKIFTPEMIGGIAFLSIIFCGLIAYLFKNRNLVGVLLLVYFSVCSSLLIANGFGSFLPMPDDAFYKFIPAGKYFSTLLHRDILGGLMDYGSWMNRSPAYTVPLGLVFAAFGDSLIAGGALSTLFGVMTIVQLYHIAQRLYDIRTAKIAALLLSLSPYYWLISVLILRDTMALFFIAWFFRLWMSYGYKSDNKTMLLMIFSFVYIGLLRPVVAGSLTLVFIAYYVFFIKRKGQFFVVLKVVTTAVFCLILVYSLTQTNIIAQLSNMGGPVGQAFKYLNIETASDRADASGQTAASSYMEGLQYRSHGEAIKVLPLLILYFMCSPLPWQVKKISHLLALSDSMMLWFLYIFFFLEVRSFIKRQPKWAIIILLYLAIGIVGSALIQGNIGAAQRHRIMFTIFIIPLAAHNLVERWGKKRRGRVTGAAGPVWRGDLGPATFVGQKPPLIKVKRGTDL
jgi:4-amino-4-deoxy-L-arabinose transferase-like glycosyltransferase